VFSARTKQVGFALTVALFAPVALVAQAAETPAPAPEATAAPDATASEEQVEGWYTELQGLHQRLTEIQERALEDPQLQASQEALGTEIRAAMTVSDSTMAAKMARMETLQAEAEAASSANDMNRLQALMLEATEIQEEFEALQRRVLEEPGMAAKLGVFQTALQAKMVQVEPEAQGLMNRFRELETLLTAAMGPPTAY
jgi:hypothetical protein